MRVGAVDLGSNSTRLLIADVTPDGVTELHRESIVTRLGQGVDTTGELAQDAIDRVRAVLDRYRAQLDEHGVTRTFAVLTSAVRDARNGEAFSAEVRDRYGLDARVLSGDEEAALTFMGAASERDPHDETPTLVIDIGGGSTELVVGRGREVVFHVSTQAGVVRHSERHLHTDPPTAAELRALRDDVRRIYEAQAARAQPPPRHAIAVGGTASQLASIDLGGPEHAHGHRLSVARIEELLTTLAGRPLEERKQTPGLDPARAPTIVAGAALLAEAAAAFGQDHVEVSIHDILLGAALRAAI
jgi:exopolyphosphatase/guanosine-5'-triphosphate,3'-diphosphate pyrophosphatase